MAKEQPISEKNLTPHHSDFSDDGQSLLVFEVEPGGGRWHTMEPPGTIHLKNMEMVKVEVDHHKVMGMSYIKTTQAVPATQAIRPSCHLH